MLKVIGMILQLLAILVGAPVFAQETFPIFQGTYAVSSYQVVNSYRQETVFTQASLDRLQQLVSMGYDCLDLGNHTQRCKKSEPLNLSTAEAESFEQNVVKTFKVKFAEATVPVSREILENGQEKLTYLQALTIQNTQVQKFYLLNQSELHTLINGYRYYSFRLLRNTEPLQLVWELSYERKTAINQKEVMQIELILEQI